MFTVVGEHINKCGNQGSLKTFLCIYVNNLNILNKIRARLLYLLDENNLICKSMWLKSVCM